MKCFADARPRPRNRARLVVVGSWILVSLAAVWGCAIAGCNGDSSSSATTGSTTGGPPPDPIIGKSCSGLDDCGEKTFCYSDDRNCGPGHCRERPASRRGFGGGDMFCGCDGKIYESINAAPFEGVDLGRNARCKLTPGVNWACGDQLICGFKPCNAEFDACNPKNECNGNNEQGDEACLHSKDFGYYCGILGYFIDSCANQEEVLDACDGCLTEPCNGSDNSHEFTSATCTEDACQLRTIECIK